MDEVLRSDCAELFCLFCLFIVILHNKNIFHTPKMTEEIEMLQIQDTLVTLDIVERFFICNLDRCHGECCIEGDAGAPITKQEYDKLKEILPEIWNDLMPQAQEVIKTEDVGYIDEEGDLVTLKISDTKNAEVLVTGVAENYMNHYVYMTPAGYENIFEEAPKYNQIFFKFEDDVEEKGEQEIAQYLLEK